MPAERSHRLVVQTLWISATLTCCSVVSKITAEGGLTALKDLKKLHSLELDETSIDDTALRSLAEMPGLRYTELWHTGVTRAGVAELQKKRPELEIKANPRR
jgi:hypothetical protein